jgi:predicted RNase H-like nuclease (RuvC/YqgF family)
MAQQLGMPPPPPQRGGGIGGMFKHKAPSPGPDFTEVKGDINNLERRLRVLEEGFTNIRRSLQVAEHNMLAKNKTFSTEIRTLTSDVTEIRKEISDIKEKIFMMVKELESAAKINEVKVLEKYINLWNPIKFVTQDEVERIIDEKLKKK